MRLHRRLLASAAALSVVLAGASAGCSLGGDDESSTNTGTVEVVLTDRATGEPAAEAEANRASRVRSHIDSSDVVKLFPPQTVLDGDVGAQQKGTPERALLEWWQAFQFHDARAVRRLTSTATRKAVGAHSLAQLVRLTGLPGIAILGASTSGDTATVQAGILNFQPPTPGAPLPRDPTGSQPASFAMAREHGRWVFDQADFLVPKAQNLQNAK